MTFLQIMFFAIENSRVSRQIVCPFVCFQDLIMATSKNKKFKLTERYDNMIKIPLRVTPFKSERKMKMTQSCFP